MDPSLTVVESFARQAGTILRSGYGNEHRIQFKSNPADLVTEVDRQSEAVLMEVIRRMFPDHRIVTEESGQQPGLENRCWYIDPLDGTTNYAHGIPIFAVSIAYAEDGKMKLGAIYDPMLDEMFSAEEGCGARLNGELIHVSEIASLAKSVLATGIPYELQNTNRSNLVNFAAFSRLTQGVRRIGSAAINQAYVACGRMEGYWEMRLRSWDVAAGTLIVKEAGGMATTIDGSPDVLQPPHAILVANPAIHPQMLRILRQNSSCE
jgi:myo-inositol-1(or 4)-monophosphatase